MRVDGSMMGLDVKRTGILPVWKKGHFSLLCDGSQTPATMLLLDHGKKKYWDLYAEKKKNRPTLDEEVGSEDAQNHNSISKTMSVVSAETCPGQYEPRHNTRFSHRQW